MSLLCRRFSTRLPLVLAARPRLPAPSLYTHPRFLSSSSSSSHPDSDVTQDTLYDGTRVQRNKRGNKQPVVPGTRNPYEVPLADHAKEFASDLANKASELASRAKKMGKKAMNEAGSSRTTKQLHTRAPSSAPRDSDSADLKDDAARLAQKGQHELRKAKLSAEKVGEDVKDEAESVWLKAKKAARRMKESLATASSTGPSYTDLMENDTLSDSWSDANANTSKVPHSAMPQNTESDANSPKNVRRVDRSEQLTTSQRRGGAWSLSDRYAGQDSDIQDPAMGQQQESVKKSLFDGPQEMPQGVGKRARDEKGRPMETGGERT